MKIIGCFIFLLATALANGQELRTKNIILITLDGYRWQEVFGGPDPRILFHHKYVEDTLVWQRFGDPLETVSRRKLMPFFWNVIASEGQLYGNRKLDSKVNTMNPHHLSYPGYNELLTGFNDPLITSNKLEVNANETVLEFINRQPSFKDKVTVFATWDAFPYILNQERSGIRINDHVTPPPGGSDPPKSDKETFQLAFEYLKHERPRVLFISQNETDAYGHEERYDDYLKAAYETDRRIASLWNWVQNDSTYRNCTTLIITTDHGRGHGKNNWQHHRRFAAGSGQLWFAVIGPDTPAFGEMKIPARYYQDQLAKTMAAFLGLNYNPVSGAGEIVQTMLAAPPTEEGNILVDQSIDGDQ